MKLMELHEIPGLPKWPGVYVTGKSVTVDQARDIITRTDTNLHHVSSFGFSNNHEFDEWFLAASGLSLIVGMEKKYLDLYHDPKLKDDPAAIRIAREEVLGPMIGFGSAWGVQVAWRNEMKIISTEYVYNTHLESCYIGGPTGWCHPDGTIYVEGHNYGKWPSVESIVRDWSTLVKEFPYLDLKCTLFSEEAQSDITPAPLVTIVVKDGEVKVCHPDLSAHDAPPETAKRFVIDENTMASLFARGNMGWSSGWPREWVDDFCARSSAVVADIFANPQKYIDKYMKEEEQE